MRALRISLAVVAVVWSLGNTASAQNGSIQISQVTGGLLAGGLPYVISAPGSYILTSNLMTSGANAINVTVDHVEIDLNGFTIVGPGPGSGTAIEAGGTSGLTVRNGVIDGYLIGISAGNDSKLIDLRISGNNQGVIGGVGCLIRENHIVNNGAVGIFVQDCKIDHNLIADNGSFGIDFCPSCEIAHNTIVRNQGGINYTHGVNIHENLINANTSCGICAGPISPPPSIMVAPPPPVIAPYYGARIVGNQIERTVSGYGIYVSTGAVIADNTIAGNFHSGIFCGALCTVSGNVVMGNNQGVVAGHGGVLVGPGSTVTANSISSNHGFGLTLPTTSGYTNNTLSGNGPGGVGPDVITPPSLTGAFGNNCSGVACP